MGTGFERESSLGSPIYERYGIDGLMLACLELGKKHNPESDCKNERCFLYDLFQPPTIESK